MENGRLKWLISEEERNAAGLTQWKGYITRKDEANILNTPEVLQMYERKYETIMPLKEKSFVLVPSFDTPAVREYTSDIDDLRNQVYSEIILGQEDIDEFDEFVTKYYEMGGQEIEDEINTIYKGQKEAFEEYLDFYKIYLEPYKD